MIKLLGLIFVFLTIPGAAALSQDGHEYSPLAEKTINYQDWELNDLQSNQSVDLRSLVKDKKLVMVVYFAAWCPNWRNEAPIAAKLYDKYKDQGFQIIGVSEYASRDDVRKFFGDSGPPYPVVIESESRDDRDKTTHYAYRQSAGDNRKWGSPWNIFLEPAKLASAGESLTEKAWVVNGELIEAEVDKFIGDTLKPKAAAAVTPCKN